jgi:hypothetical protein
MLVTEIVCPRQVKPALKPAPKPKPEHPDTVQRRRGKPKPRPFNAAKPNNLS